MKSKIIIFCCLLFTGCSPSVFYQLYEVNTTNGTDPRSMIFENDSVKVEYNFWNENAIVAFLITNKTERYITLHLDKSYFVNNGITYDYYSGITTTEYSQNSTGITVGQERIGKSPYPKWEFSDYTNYKSTLTLSSTHGNSVTATQLKTLSIPPSSSRAIAMYSVNNLYTANSGLIPSKATSTPVYYSMDDTPFKFSNIIAFCFEDSCKIIRLKHEFFVETIQNFNFKGFWEWDDNAANYKGLHANPRYFYVNYDPRDIR